MFESSVTTVSSPVCPLPDKVMQVCQR